MLKGSCDDMITVFTGAVVGCLLDLQQNTLSYRINGAVLDTVPLSLSNLEVLRLHFLPRYIDIFIGLLTYS